MWNVFGFVAYRHFRSVSHSRFYLSYVMQNIWNTRYTINSWLKWYFANKCPRIRRQRHNSEFYLSFYYYMVFAWPCFACVAIALLVLVLFLLFLFGVASLYGFVASFSVQHPCPFNSGVRKPMFMTVKPECKHSDNVCLCVRARYSLSVPYEFGCLTICNVNYLLKINICEWVKC